MPICVGQVCIDVLIVGRLDVDGQSFASIGLRKTDAASDWLLIKCNCNFSVYQKEDVLFQLKILLLLAYAKQTLPLIGCS